MSPRPRDRILGNLETVYREAYERARTAGDERRMADLDSAYQREQLLLEVLLDIRDALGVRPAESKGADAADTINTIRRIAKLR
jgi:hypothetical protein